MAGELVKRFATVRPFLPPLCEVIRFGGRPDGDRVLAALRVLPRGVPPLPGAPQHLRGQLQQVGWPAYQRMDAIKAADAALIEHQARAKPTSSGESWSSQWRRTIEFAGFLELVLR